jgi:hypothetical protein
LPFLLLEATVFEAFEWVVGDWVTLRESFCGGMRGQDVIARERHQRNVMRGDVGSAGSPQLVLMAARARWAWAKMAL